jgi:uncharacterized protein (DUF362 family)
MTLQSNRVLCASSPRADYGSCESVAAPELYGGLAATPALVTLRNLLRYSKLDEENYGLARWNPLGALINEGDTVLIKPNWVHHVNRSGNGLDCLVTDSTVIDAILTYVLKAKPRSIVVGDAPIQGCSFESLRAESGIDEVIKKLEKEFSTVFVRDLRRTVLPGGQIGSLAIENCRPLEDYILFDLGDSSELEPITNRATEFRVTMYNPHALARTHAVRKHQYLIAREAVEADVVINVPKLKTHKKACLTGALKNIVGINGHKEYLPHHRKGGSKTGGDCYEGGAVLKGFVEDIYDAINSAPHPKVRRGLVQISKLMMKATALMGMDTNLEGSWYGNDTVWRMVLDLQRILYYGRNDGTLDNNVQRTVITITDAIISGQGNGPLAPTPVPFGIMTLGLNTAAIEWIHALLMGFDPHRIPLTRQAFSSHRYPLASFPPSDIVVEVNGEELNEEELISRYSHRFRPAEGWEGHCELRLPVSRTMA